MRGADLKRAIEAMGFEWSLPAGGSHYRIKTTEGKVVAVALHNGLRTEIRPDQLRYIARQLGVAFKDLLRK